MIIRVDVDDTLCFSSATAANNWDYSTSVPRERNIKRVNKLYDQGHTIIIWTARGTGTGKLHDAIAITKFQMKEWGVKYHSLEVGKPIYDLLIDDKTLNPHDWDLYEGVLDE